MMSSGSLILLNQVLKIYRKIRLIRESIEIPLQQAQVCMILTENG